MKLFITLVLLCFLTTVMSCFKGYIIGGNGVGEFHFVVEGADRNPPIRVFMKFINKSFTMETVLLGDKYYLHDDHFTNFKEFKYIISCALSSKSKPSYTLVDTYITIGIFDLYEPDVVSMLRLNKLNDKN